MLLVCCLPTYFADVWLLVYLQASPEACLERIKKRNREEESSVPLVSVLAANVFNFNVNLLMNYYNY